MRGKKERDQNQNEKIQCRLQIVLIWESSSPGIWEQEKLWYENLLPCNLMKSSESALTWNPMQSQWCASEAFFLFQYSRKVTAGAGGRLFWLRISVFPYMICMCTINWIFNVSRSCQNIIMWTDYDFFANVKNKRTKVGSLYSFKIDLNLINEILVKVTFVERVESVGSFKL